MAAGDARTLETTALAVSLEHIDLENEVQDAECASETQDQELGHEGGTVEVTEDDEDDTFVGYNEWAKAQLGITLCTDLVYDTPHGVDAERGVYIAEDVAPQTEVLRIPMASLLTLQWITEQPSTHPLYANVSVFAALRSSQDALWTIEMEDELLALALMYERWIAEDNSPWAPHICVLPTTYHNPLYFTDAEMTQLESTELFALAKHMQQQVQADFERLAASVVPEIVATLSQQPESLHAEAKAAIAAAFSLDHYIWAISTIWSRFVSITLGQTENLEEDIDQTVGMQPKRLKAMAPVFDLLNHDPNAEMSHFFDPKTNTFQLVSHQHWQAGSQLCINYGALSNHKLFALYGFVLENNPFNSIEIYMPMEASITTQFDEKVEILAENGLLHDVTAFELVEEEINELLLIAIRIQELEEEDLKETTLKAAAALILEGDVWSVKNEVATLTRIIYLLQKMLEALDQRNENFDLESAQTLHERMIDALCSSDKNLLAENIDMLRWRLLEYLPQMEAT